VSLYLDDENDELQTGIDDRLGSDGGTCRMPSPELYRLPRFSVYRFESSCILSERRTRPNLDTLSLI
jgi:hypothetical protein